MKLLLTLSLAALLAASCQSTSDAPSGVAVEEVAAPMPEVRYYVIADT